MTDKKISALPAVLQQDIASTTDVLPIVNAGATKKATAYAITYSSLNASVATTFAYDATPTVATRIGVQGTGTSWIFNGPSPNPNYATGLVIDSTYDSGTRQAETNLRALGIYSSGGYGSELSLWTSNGTAIARQVTVKNNGDVQVKTGNLIQGTAAKGINFTANTPAAGMTSQLLNWYEEGTWTPSVYDAVTGGNKSATNGSGTYTRIGRQVTARFTLDSISTVGLTAGNAMSVGNLPFTAVGDTMGSFYTYRVGGGTAQSASLVVSSGTARLRIFLYSGNSATTDVLIKISDLVSGTSGVYGTITYFV